MLLDTSFFIDYSIHSEAFVDFVVDCKKNNVIFVTNVPVVTEFCRGSENHEVFAKKIALVSSIIDYLLPINPNVFEKELPWLVENYAQDGKKVSLTDFILGAQTKIHNHDLCLLTKNPTDFLSSIFTYKTHFLLQLERGLQVYGVYFYSEPIESDK